MGKLKHVPDKSFLTCDKGSLITQIKVTHNGNGHLYGQKWVTEADVVPNENIIPFGSCKIDGTCKYEPIYWDKCQDGFKINGFKPIFENACLLCKKGGKITVDFDTPQSILQEMAESLKEPEHWILGLAIGNEQGMTLADKFKADAGLFQSHRNNYLNNQGARNIRNISGDFGEMQNRLDYKAKGYQIRSTNPVGSNIPGTRMKPIDITAYAPKSGMDIIDETKFKSGSGIPQTNSKPTRSGRQGSTRWFQDRLNVSMSANDANRIRGKMRNNSPQLQKVITKVEPNGNITRYQLNPNGTTGNPVNIGAANTYRGNSKATIFLNNVGRNIQANNGVASANRWFTQNAHTIAKVGKVTGRGLIVVGIVFEGYNIYSAYQEEGEVGDKTKKAVSSASGALVGGIAGSKIGATIGALGGPVGVVVGGIVGGVVGAIVGSGVGKWIASWF